MKEKIKIICLILITGSVLITTYGFCLLIDQQVEKDRLYLSAYDTCIEYHQNIFQAKFICIGVLNGRSD